MHIQFKEPETGGDMGVATNTVGWGGTDTVINHCPPPRHCGCCCCRCRCCGCGCGNDYSYPRVTYTITSEVN